MMIPTNKGHLRRVAVWGGSAAFAFACLSLIKFPAIVCFSILIGGAIGIFNILSIVKLVESLAGAAASGAAPGRAAKTFATFIHVLKLVLIFGILLALVLTHMINLFGFLLGFTLILIANIFAGFATLKENPDDDIEGE